jgi:hypothetical protein
MSGGQLFGGFSVTTVSAMEGKGAEVLGSGLDTIKAVMDALDAAGVELLNHGAARVPAQSEIRALAFVVLFALTSRQE